MMPEGPTSGLAATAGPGWEDEMERERCNLQVPNDLKSDLAPSQFYELEMSHMALDVLARTKTTSVTMERHSRMSPVLPKVSAPDIEAVGR
jgi:hypothetical protein